MKRTLIVLVILMLGTVLHAQNNGFTNRARALYILDIAKNVKWSKTASPFDFRIAVLDKDTALVNKMRVEATNRKEMHGKPLSIMHYQSIDDIGSVDVIFFERKNRFSVDRVFQKIAGKQVLLITEGYQFHKTMVNFLIINDHKRYEVNEAKIKAAGLKVNRALLASSVKSEADWSYLYEHSLLDIASYKKTIKKQRELIRSYKAKLDTAQQETRAVQSSLSQLQTQYDSTRTRIHADSLALRKLERSLASKRSQLTLLQKQNENLEEQVELQKQQIEQLNTLVAEQEQHIQHTQDLLVKDEEKESEKEEEVEQIPAGSESSSAYYLIIAALCAIIAIMGIRMARGAKAKA